MEIPVISGKTSPFAKPASIVENAEQRQNSEAVPAAEGDSVSLSEEARWLAKSVVGTQNDNRVPVIENRDQAGLAVQKFVELLRQRGGDGLIGQSTVHAGKLKALLI